MKSDDIKQKIVDKKLSDVVDLDEDKAKNEDLFADLEDDLFSKPIAKPGGAGGSLGDRKTTLPTYGWEDTKFRERLDDRRIREKGSSGVPVQWNFASKQEADKSIARRDNLNDVMTECMDRLDEFKHDKPPYDKSNLTQFVQEVVEYAYKSGAHFRKENG